MLKRYNKSNDQSEPYKRRLEKQCAAVSQVILCIRPSRPPFRNNSITEDRHCIKTRLRVVFPFRFRYGMCTGLGIRLWLMKNWVLSYRCHGATPSLPHFHLPRQNLADWAIWQKLVNQTYRSHTWCLILCGLSIVLVCLPAASWVMASNDRRWTL